MKFYAILGLTALPFVLSCQAQKGAAPAAARPKNSASATKNSPSATKNTTSATTQITLGEGKGIFLKAQQMNVTFKGIRIDSRCPAGVNCIWQGVAVAQVQFMSVTSCPWDFELATVEDSSKGYTRWVDAEGYRYSLIRVEPQAAANTDLKGQYRITLQVEKLPAADQTEPTEKRMPPPTRPAPPLK